MTISPALTPPQGHPRFPLMDAMRGVAVLLVVVLHVPQPLKKGDDAWWSHYTTLFGDLGVAIFFLISGFLLYRPFAAARLEGRPRPRLRSYARRRAIRIVPAYWVALVVIGATLGLAGVFSAHFLAFFGFAQVYNEHWAFEGIKPAWSLNCEVAFYLALPLYAYAAARLVRRARGEFLILALLGLASLTYRALVPALGLSQLPVLISIAGYVDLFAIGMGLALFSAATREHGRWPRAVRGLNAVRDWAWPLALALLTFVAFGIGLPTGNRALAYPVPYTEAQWVARHVGLALVALLLMLPAALEEPRGPVRAFLGSRTMAWIGLVSYGTYLWHFPLMSYAADVGVAGKLGSHPFLAFLVLSVVGSILVGALSYYVVERPALAFKEPRRRSRPWASNVRESGTIGSSAD